MQTHCLPSQRKVFSSIHNLKLFIVQHKFVQKVSWYTSVILSLNVYLREFAFCDNAANYMPTEALLTRQPKFCENMLCRFNFFMTSKKAIQSKQTFAANKKKEIFVNLLI